MNVDANKYIQEIGLLYPVLKTEISIMYPDISLIQFFQMALAEIDSGLTQKYVFKEALKKIME